MQQANNENRNLDGYNVEEIIHFSKNSLIIHVTREADPASNRLREDKILKILLRDEITRENQFADNFLNDTVWQNLRRYNFDGVVTYNNVDILNVNINDIFTRYYNNNVPEKYNDLLIKSPIFTRDSNYFSYELREYSIYDANNKNIYNRYFNDNGRFDEEKFRKDFIKVLNALKSVHDRGFAHHDIKPSSFLFSNDNIMISDFENAINTNENGKPIYRNMREYRLFDIKKMVCYTPYTQNINKIYNVDMMGHFLNSYNNENDIERYIYLDAQDYNLFRADYFSLGLAVLSIFMGDNDINSYESFTSSIKTNILNMRNIDRLDENDPREYPIERDVISKIVTYFKYLNNPTPEMENDRIFNEYIRKFQYGNELQIVGKIVYEAIVNESGHDILLFELSSIVDNDISILRLQDRMRLVCQRLREHDSDRTIINTINEMMRNTITTNFNIFKGNLFKVISDYILANNGNQQHIDRLRVRLNVLDRSNLYKTIREYERNNDLYIRILSNKDILYYFAYNSFINYR